MHFRFITSCVTVSGNRPRSPVKYPLPQIGVLSPQQLALRPVRAPGVSQLLGGTNLGFGIPGETVSGLRHVEGATSVQFIDPVSGCGVSARSSFEARYQSAPSGLVYGGLLASGGMVSSSSVGDPGVTRAYQQDYFTRRLLEECRGVDSEFEHWFLYCCCVGRVWRSHSILIDNDL